MKSLETDAVTSPDRALDALAATVRGRPAAAAAAAGSIALGIVVASLGFGTGAALICVGLFLSGIVDRRLPLLAALVLLPSLTAFSNLPVVAIGNGTLDFRLLLTGGLIAAVGPWLTLPPTRPDRIGLALIAVLVILVVLAPLNDVAPLKSLPPIGRWLAYVAAYLAARRWLGSVEGFGLIVGAIAFGMVLPALSGVVQLLLGNVAAATGFRITGVYRTSPVGLALAMQVVTLALAAGRLVRGRPRTRFGWLGLGLIVASAFVLIESSTRLVFASFVASLILIELLHRRFRAIPVILVGAAIVLGLQSNLLSRLTSVIPQPVPTPAPGASVDPGTVVGGEVTISDPSLRFRLYLWGTMLPYVAESPIVGQGTGSFATLFERKSGLARIAPHNDYLGILIENGLLGLIAYVFVLVVVVVTLLRMAVLASGPVRVVAITALVEVGALNILNAINNALLYLDLQVAMWALVGAAVGVEELTRASWSKANTTFGAGRLRRPRTDTVG